ncbi:response regulator, partial [Methylobacterium crusticola]|uniref:response regulator n=1 Tax=Methylobacterium crusticola TaxID=1697972 RepID=UPI001EE1C869
RQLRQKPFLTHIPIIFVSAKAFESEQQQGHEAGGNDYITKPFRLQLLAEKISYHLNEPSHPENNSTK